MGVNIQTIKDISGYVSGELNALYPPEEIKALVNIISTSVSSRKGIYLKAFPEAVLSVKARTEVVSITSKLKQGVPIQYILGETEFYNCIIKVSPSTLIPRPETEELADIIIKENRDFEGSVIDIGTGSGCLAIALSVNLPRSSVSATDISEEALAVARQNNLLNKAKVKFLKSDIFGDIHFDESFDMIVSNPPYVCESEKAAMHPNVLLYEPASALFVPDNDPLVYYRRILEVAEQILKKDGRIYFEINERMGEKIKELALSFHFISGDVIKDINGKDRFFKCRRDARH